MEGGKGGQIGGHMKRQTEKQKDRQRDKLTHIGMEEPPD